MKSWIIRACYDPCHVNDARLLAALLSQSPLSSQSRPVGSASVLRSRDARCHSGCRYRPGKPDMTYCVGVLLNDGVVLASDSRTNAGVDNFATFCKMTVFERPGDRLIVLLSSGNLAGTQAVVNVLRQRGEEENDGVASMWNARTMFDIANLVSDAVREIEDRDGKYLMSSATPFNASFIIGGQIKGEPPRLFRTFAEGNFIEAGTDTPFFQTGEAKYGKPI